jgi:hypothetical protein
MNRSGKRKCNESVKFREAKAMERFPAIVMRGFGCGKQIRNAAQNIHGALRIWNI